MKMSQKRLEMMLQFFNVSLSSILFNSLFEGISFYIFNVLKCNNFLCTGYFCSGFLSWSIMLLVFQLFSLAQNLVRLSFCSCYFCCSGVLYFTRNIVTVAAYIYIIFSRPIQKILLLLGQLVLWFHFLITRTIVLSQFVSLGKQFTQCFDWCHQPCMISFFYFQLYFLDLRDDKQFFVDHPGAVPITTAQVKSPLKSLISFFLLCVIDSGMIIFISLKEKKVF